MTDQEDYSCMLGELGVTEELVRSQSENTDDLIPVESENARTAVSDIEGTGVFATKSFPENSRVALARVGSQRTPVGRYTNHSKNPNSKMVPTGGDVLLVTTRPVVEGEELTVDYRQVVTDIQASRTYHEKLDALERELVKLPVTEIPTNHKFIKNPGMYVREAFAPAGTLLTSRIHKTDHPFVMMCGEQSILEPDGQWRRVVAPFMGVTKSGSRRVVLVHSDTVMVSFHATEETDLDKVEAEIFEDHYEHLGLDKQGLDFIKSIQRGPQSLTITGE